MLTIYTSPESLYCAKLRVLLRHKQGQWQEIEPPGGCGSAEYREQVPAGTMPALVDGDLLLADSEAIAEYLNETIDQPPMLPADARARAGCRERSRFHDTRLEPELRKLFPHIAHAGRDADFVTTQARTLNLRLQELSRLLANSDANDLQDLSLGDCGFPISFAWLDAFAAVLGFELEWPAGVLAYRSRIEAHSAVAAELQAYTPAMIRWLESKGV
ncbi:MAG: glutathione S-transferase family protein [Gammaproteobacteria bacterium]|nr:glutathione S-transferase family protein [Gammaproteobacteria bacterium]MCP4981806.1 glutathione S-transferase family protein [Gammaproteobacteria bacterium]